MPVAGWLASGSAAVASPLPRSSAGARRSSSPRLPAASADSPRRSFGFGAGFGAINVAANAQGLALERQYGRSIFSSFHAAFSAGGACRRGSRRDRRGAGDRTACELRGRCACPRGGGPRDRTPAAATGGGRPQASPDLRPPARASCSSSARRRSSRCSPREPQPTGAPSISRTPLARPPPWPRSRIRASRSRWRRAAASATA